MITYEAIKKANDTIKTTPIKGKEYAEVNQRIKAFRMVYPEGSITTELLSNENGICVFKAVVTNGVSVLGTGTAYEKETSSYINKTSYIENCETSAVGRALGMAGFGIDVSIASAEEVENAINNQRNQIDPAQKYIDDANASIIDKPKIQMIQDLIARAKCDPASVLQRYRLSSFEQMTFGQWTEAVGILKRQAGVK